MSDASGTKPAAATERTDLTGRTVDRFLIQARLGAGGMGEVYRASDQLLKRTVALKRIAPELREDPYYRRRFFEEAERASKLNDPHVAHIHDVIEEHGDIFLVMEYVEGATLRALIGRPLPVEKFLPIAIECAEALVAAHAEKLLHCDIKPENIIRTPAGKVKILDFGVARPLISQDDAESSSTTADKTVEHFGGTMPYMAPEVLLKRRWDVRSDLWSLGVVFYELLAGIHPFRAETPVATLDRILHEQPQPLSALNPAVPPHLERIISKLLARQPAERYASAAELLADLRAGSLPAAVPAAKLSQWLRRYRVPLMAAFLILVALGIAARLYFRSPAFAERNWVVLADIENQTGDPLFDRTVSELLRSALTQSRYVNVVPRSQVLEAAKRTGRKEIQRVDLPLAREICLRDNYRAVITGSVARADSGFALTLVVDDPRRELAVARLTQTFTTPAEVYSALDHLTRALRKELGESLPQIERSAKPLELVTTPSLPALQRYTQAMEFYRQGNLERFVDYAQSALELDPNFAMAHLYLGHAFERMGNLEASRLHMEKALAGLDRVGEREKLLILARDHSNQGRFEKAADAYRRLTDLYPDDIEGLRGLAEHAQWIGRPQTAVEAGRRVVQLVPHSAVDHARLLHYLNRVNQFDETLRLYNEAASSGLLTPHHRWAAGVALLARDDPESARREFALLARSGGSYEENLGQLYQSRVLIYEGKLAEAEQALRTGIVLDQKYGSLHWSPLRKFFLARVQLLRDNRTDAARLSRWLASDTLKFSEPADLRRAVLLACQLEDLASARKILVRFDLLRRQQESAYAQSAYLTALAAAQLLEGNADAALESAQTATVYYTSVDSLLILAEVHSARGDWRAAADAHLRLLNLKGQILNHEFPADLALTHLALAGSLEKMGTESERRQALQEVRTFLHLWRGADAGLPALRQARALESRLAVFAGDVISDARAP